MRRLLFAAACIALVGVALVDRPAATFRGGLFGVAAIATLIALVLAAVLLGLRMLTLARRMRAGSLSPGRPRLGRGDARR